MKLTKESSVEPGQYRTSRVPYVEEILMELSPQSPTQEIIVMKPTQAGFALDVDTPIPTPSGWSTMADIKVGDVVFDENGNQCNVTFVSEIFKDHECCKVFFSDGAEVICDKNHLWTVTDTRNYKILKTKTLTTQEIMETAHDCYSKHASKRNRYAIDVAKPINTKKKDFLISPYTLGCWIGDGSSSGSAITQSNGDAKELMQHIIDSGHRAEIVPSDKYKGDTTMIRVETKDKKRCKRGHVFDIVGRTKSRECKECYKQRYLFKKYGTPMDPIVLKSTFHSKLVKLNLLYNKHIPDEYLRGSYQQRLELLQGLMDTDGTICKKGSQEFNQVNPDIANSVYELVVSLGIKASMAIRKAQFNKKMAHGGFSDMKPQYRIKFYAQTDKPVFKLKRKLERMKFLGEVKRPKEVTRRRIIDVFPVITRPVKCISVDSNSKLYLCSRSMIPTHNTTLASVFLFAVAHLYPGPCMMAMPTDDMAKGHSKKKIAPSIAAIDVLNGVIKEPKSRKSGNTLLLKEFSGGSWKFTGSNSPASARSDSIRYLILDDYDGFVQDMGGEGSPGDLFKKRTDAFGVKRKIYINSTPTLEGSSHIEKEFSESSQGYYHVPCPHCNEYQFLEFGRVDSDYGIKFKRDSGGNVIDVWYVCQHCKGRIEEYQKTEMMLNGKYVHQFPDVAKRGFKINALYSPVGWVSWSQIVDEFLKAKREADKGRVKQLQVWTNTRLAETFKQIVKTGMDDVESILKAKCDLPQHTAPHEAVALTCFIDVQKHGFWFVIRAWAPNFKSWNIHHGYLTSWDEVESLLFSTDYPVDGSSRRLRIWRTAVDTGGGEKYNEMSMTEETYFWLRKNTGRGCGLWGTKGSSTPLPGKIRITKPMDRTPSGKPLPGGLQIIHLNTLALKDAFHHRLNMAIDGGDMAAYLHKETGEEYARHILAEEKRLNKRGMPEWVQTSARNDMLDCECGCLALAEPEWPGGGVNLFRPIDGSEYYNPMLNNTKTKRRVLSRGI